MTYKKKPQLRSPEELLVAAQTFARLADHRGVQVALVGGYALQFYGSRRLTDDVDFVAAKNIRPGKGVSFVSHLSFGGQRFDVDGVEVDAIQRKDEYASLYREGLAHAVVIDPEAPPVVPLEYLLAMKLAAQRPKDEADIDAALASGEVDVKAALKIVQKHMGKFAADVFQNMAAYAKVRKR